MKPNAIKSIKTKEQPNMTKINMNPTKQSEQFNLKNRAFWRSLDLSNKTISFSIKFLSNPCDVVDNCGEQILIILSHNLGVII